MNIPYPLLVRNVYFKKRLQMLFAMRSVLLYACTGAMILAWWCFAFRHSFDFSVSHEKSSFALPHFSDSYDDISLSKLRRKKLHQALTGNYRLMIQLIDQWEKDAYLLESKGLQGIRHLSKSDRVLCHRLLQQIQQKKTSTRYPRFLPQTFASAGILLALLSPEQIVALPKGLKEDVELYPAELTSRISLTVDRHHSEELFMSKPSAAFVSFHYSHPAMLEALKKQGIKIIPHQTARNISDIRNMILFLGKQVERPLQAQLLSLFIKASLIAIDNRLTAIKMPRLKNALYLTYYSRYYLPTSSTPMGQLLYHLKFPVKELSAAVELEHLLKLNPSYLIISSNYPSLGRHPLNSLKAVKSGHVFYVRDTVQQSPNQYIVLAYYDVAKAIAQMESI